VVSPRRGGCFTHCQPRVPAYMLVTCLSQGGHRQDEALRADPAQAQRWRAVAATTTSCRSEFRKRLYLYLYLSIDLSIACLNGPERSRRRKGPDRNQPTEQANADQGQSIRGQKQPVTLHRQQHHDDPEARIAALTSTPASGHDHIRPLGVRGELRPYSSAQPDRPGDRACPVHRTRGPRPDVRR
jgi:hypothetical protein